MDDNVLLFGIVCIVVAVAVAVFGFVYTREDQRAHKKRKEVPAAPKKEKRQKQPQQPQTQPQQAPKLASAPEVENKKPVQQNKAQKEQPTPKQVQQPQQQPQKGKDSSKAAPQSKQVAPVAPSPQGKQQKQPPQQQPSAPVSNNNNTPANGKKDKKQKAAPVEVKVAEEDRELLRLGKDALREVREKERKQEELVKEREKASKDSGDWAQVKRATNADENSLREKIKELEAQLDKANVQIQFSNAKNQDLLNQLSLLKKEHRKNPGAPQKANAGKSKGGDALASKNYAKASANANANNGNVAAAAVATPATSEVNAKNDSAGAAEGQATPDNNNNNNNNNASNGKPQREKKQGKRERGEKKVAEPAPADAPTQQ